MNGSAPECIFSSAVCIYKPQNILRPDAPPSVWQLILTIKNDIQGIDDPRKKKVEKPFPVIKNGTALTLLKTQPSPRYWPIGYYSSVTEVGMTHATLVAAR